MLIISRRILKTLLVLNWLFVAAFAILLLALVVPASLASIERAAGGTVDPLTLPLLLGATRWVMLLGMAAGVCAHVIFGRMLAIVDTTVAGDPFSDANGQRLRVMGWAMLAIQLLDLGFGYISFLIETGTDETFGWSPSIGGWIAVLMLFVLARVFEQGARMRDDLAMTV